MKKRIFAFFICIVLLIPVLSISASADIGPKPSVVIDFKGLENQKYYVTLLSKVSSTGPYSAYNGKYEKHFDSEKDREIWEKFVAYKDADGYYFLQYFADCSGSNRFRWGYYPPSSFKILIYFPESDSFVVSADTYDRYAFDSYYTVDATKLDIKSVTTFNKAMGVKRTYDYTWEVISLLARIVITVAVELALAWCCGYRARKQFRLILITNISTQVILNMLLNIINFKQGYFAFILNYAWMEIVVFVIEGIIYSKYLRRFADDNKKVYGPWKYSFIANAASFAAGMLIAKLIPGIF